MTYTRQGIVFVLGLAAYGCSGETRTVYVEGNASEEVALGCFSFGPCDGAEDSSIGAADAGVAQTAGSGGVGGSLVEMQGGAGGQEQSPEAGVEEPPWVFPDVLLGAWMMRAHTLFDCEGGPPLFGDTGGTPTLVYIEEGYTLRFSTKEEPYWLPGEFEGDIWHPEVLLPTYVINQEIRVIDENTLEGTYTRSTSCEKTLSEWIFERVVAP